jgi:O-acetyl-ADP-ribose deacetylase (regulator of RNase III)
MQEFFSGRLKVQQGDITRLTVDAIVNAANSSLLGGGGVDGAIHRAGGPTILSECREIRETRYPEGLPPGKAVATGGGNLPSAWIIHTVGPIWDGGSRGEEETLRKTYRNSLLLARKLGAQNIAFPAISTGVYRFPKELAAKIVMEVIQEFIEEYEMPEEIILIFFSSTDETLFLKVVDTRS